ncbi:2TM domain-containing protein [Chryseobacterium sp. SIMBA_029]|uniref:2TM domain-containing protein n=1 Tax=Chryseobacterium sp. SIMBA_029 TaxID=3085772 RepID=UPI00397C9C9F
MDYNNAYKRVNELKKFYKHLAWFAIIAGISLLNDYSGHRNFHLSLFNGSILLLIWGAVLVMKAVKLFIFNADWERRILEKELKKDKAPINF